MCLFKRRKTLAKFNEAYSLTEGFEGEYIFDADDPGGETYKGIARKFHPNWEGWKIIDVHKNQEKDNFRKALGSNVELQKLVDIFYKETFWDRMSLSNAESQAVANYLFDIAVNCGISKSSKYIQRTLNVLNRCEKDWPDINVDGKIGPQTIGVLNLAIKKREKNILKALTALRIVHYFTISERSEKFEKYVNGWLNRS